MAFWTCYSLAFLRQFVFRFDFSCEIFLNSFWVFTKCLILNYKIVFLRKA